MRRHTLRRFLLVPLVLPIVACGDNALTAAPEQVSANTAANTRAATETSARRLLHDYVAMRTSIAAGFQSNGISAATQRQG